MVLDLNKILFYAEGDGSLRAPTAGSRKRYITVVDGIVAGHGNGPEAPDAFEAGVILAGTNPVAVDAACAKWMGFSWERIPTLKHGFAITRYPLVDASYEEILVQSSDERFDRPLHEVSADDVYRFRPHFGWQGPRRDPMKSFASNLTWYQQVCHRLVLPLADVALRLRVSPRFRELLDLQWQTREEIDLYRGDRIRRLIDFAAARVPFYRDFFREQGLSPEDIRTVADLGKLPVIGKVRIARAAGGPQGGQDARGKVYEMKSSGSTGEQTTVLLDNDCMEEVFATQLLFWSWGGFADGGSRTSRPACPSSAVRCRSLKDFVFRCSYSAASHLGDAELDQIVRKLERKRIRWIFGYASSVYVIARYARELGRQIELDGIFTWGDSLFPHYRELIEEVFRCRVFDCYGLGEGLQCASQCDRHDALHEAMHGVIVEIVDSDGQACPEGELGSVVVTRLTPGPMPLIRYDTGDVASFVAGDCSCGRKLRRISRIQGRNTDIVTTPAGDRLIVHFFTQIFEHTPEIAQFQVRQEEPESIAILYIPGPGFNAGVTEKVERQILEKCRFPLTIEFRKVDEIPLQKSNKRRFVISSVPFH